MSCEHYWRDGIQRVERGERDPHRETCDDCRRAHQMREQLIRALPDVAGRATGDPQWQARVWSRIAREETARARRSYWISGAMVAACALVVVCVTWMARTASESAGMVSRSASVPADSRGTTPFEERVVRRQVGSAGPSAVRSGGQDGAVRTNGPDQERGFRHPAVTAGRDGAVRTSDSEAGDRRVPVQLATLTDGRPHLEIIKGKLLVRGAMSAAVHDRIRYAVPPHSEVRMYRAERLVLRCPAEQAAPGCVPDAQGLVAEAELATAGEYQLIVISSVTAAPVGTLDGDLAAVVAAGGDYKVTELSVR